MHFRSFCRWLLVCCLLAGIVAAVLHLYRWSRPYGDRTGFIQGTLLGLRRYAAEHEGWFPKSAGTPLKCLQELNPKYLDDPVLLAGVSGNIEQLKQTLRDNRPLDETVSSWVYWPGFKEDDKIGTNLIAILWEKKEGVSGSGKRTKGIAVGLSNGSWRQVSLAEWNEFQAEQGRLRAELVAKRKGESK